MRYSKRITAAALAGLMLCPTGTIGGAGTVYAAPAGVNVDEAMYVNLDYYGNAEKINVVKGLSVNGNTEYTDYGNYTQVQNMSSDLAPTLGDGSVTWTFPEDQKGRFYYKVSLENGQVTLPWDFDVSYKLNGVPINADKLAGASGLVEINVKATPNDGAKEYYRNNMMLMVAVPVDLTKCYSVEADGSQTQNLGDTTAVVFSALPGEEGDYTVRIGTDSFESIGVIMAMVPGTVEDLEHIKDLKEAKDTWQDAGDSLYDSLEQMAKSVEGMRNGVNTLQSGLSSAEDARQVWSGAKDGILASNDESLAALSALSEQLSNMVPYLQTAKDAAATAHEGLDNVVDTLTQMQDPLRKLHTRLKGVESNMESLSSQLPELRQLMIQIATLDTQFQANEQMALAGIQGVSEAMEDADEVYFADEEDVATESQARVAANAGQIVAQLQQKVAYLNVLAQGSSKLVANMSGLLDEGADASKYIRELTDNFDYLIEDTAALNDSMDTYYPDLQDALTDSQELVNRTTEALNSGTNSLSLLQNAVRNSSDSFDAAARESLKGSMAVLDQSLQMIDATTAMRQAGRTMKDTLDSELDKFDTENNFLFMDPSAPKESLTSDQNQEPKTLQVILRTDEISLDDEEEKTLDAETKEESVSPLRRMWNVLVKMWQSIVQIFKDR